ncbi:MAG: hypothetical protein N5P05_000677 [Chroococcopsis gigantea SAG 12.99]|jgi:dipeptidyl aminopeptidase/acylaminoacyl peptidase|nr:S9 family peptidase [Chlorogloea purpurea SAG 13.99]MDV2999071.1 hypothetical protein [Chroococcopsis gigantea SAG 12.99]
MNNAYGSWQSPISSDLIVSESIGLGGVTHCGDDIYWLEGRPQEGGRNVLVKLSHDGTTVDITPPPFNVRTRIHEYGGGAYLISDGVIYFSNFQDQCLYKQVFPDAPKLLTPPSKRRYGDMILDSGRGRLLCVCEDHSNPDTPPENTIIALDIATGQIETLIAGDDFYTSPRLSPDGSKLAWISWNLPDMPWDNSTLWIGAVDKKGSITERQPIAGGENESVCEPRWCNDSELYFSSDRDNWWNLYSYDGTIQPVYQFDAEFAYPHWVFGLSTYGFQDQSRIVCTYTRGGRWYLGAIDMVAGELKTFDFPYTNISSLTITPQEALFIGGSFTESPAVIKLNLETGETTILKVSTNISLDPSYISIPEMIEFPTDNGLTAYAWYYPPRNPDYEAPEGTLPPLLVKSHGGPTAAASSSFSLRVQYWTTRGFGYLDVNYGGSTGYGREYRQRLNGNWGIVDVRDCINGAEYLVKRGRVDGDRLAISGGSAGGYTTLVALTFYDTFKAGASYYGVSDLEALAQDTHKFESRYLDRLVGEYPREKEIYRQRSPIHYIDRLSRPVIFFQGLEDKVVPPNQAEIMVAAINSKGLPVAYVTFPDEGHGFRKAANIKMSLDGEFYFYSRLFGFTPADKIEPIPILNL